MSEVKQKGYSGEFKESAAELANESSQSIAQTARELGINVNTYLLGLINTQNLRIR
ncbi:Transposase [Candidatus Jidaibacter acanthamoeba]|uniref:Transposase n=1 Tax=Candidatus Jidaibacter acanthamoebae TaxID=86105 RepID=A0A0C1N0D9_9RICK|nr:transposase [Candidatus Jidaibacter acanthamoeba]KIE05781.1 Transposase [Candidatus Jidaibacter acanthamoeba]